LEKADADLFEVKIVDSRVVVSDAGGAAITLWQTDGSNGPARIHLEHNTIEAGRILSAAGLHQRIELTTEGNTFAFRESVLSCLVSERHDCRQLVHWNGHANCYRGSAEWLMISGAAGIRGLSAWREYWRDSEGESTEEKPADLVETTPDEGAPRSLYSLPSR
jgi:hypothetical protein